MKSIVDMNIAGKRVFVRVDFNVPLDDHRHITDETRIKAALPTLKFALEQGAKLIVASHLGRPKGERVDRFSLSPVAERLGRLLGMDVRMAPDCIGPEVQALADRMADGEVILLENLRFHPGEQKNEDEFARQLAGLCDVYINDAFAVSHRANASVVAITRYVPDCAAGLLLKRELDHFQKAMADPKRPLVAIIGGAKVSSKLAALENMLRHVDKIIIGGAMANTFLKATGGEVGKSRVETDMVETAGAILTTAVEKSIKFYLPVDVVVADRLAPDAATKVVPVQEIPANRMALDIGPASSLLYAAVLHDAGTIVWNGPMGVFEMEAFSNGTLEMARHVAGSQAMSIVGGGDTDAAVHQSGEAGNIDYISTGGGAFLTLLEGKTLPAVAALNRIESRPQS